MSATRREVSSRHRVGPASTRTGRNIRGRSRPLRRTGRVRMEPRRQPAGPRRGCTAIRARRQSPSISRPVCDHRPGTGRGVDPAKIFGLAVALLGALNFVWGFLPEVSAPRSGATLSVFAVGPAYVPILLLIAGLLALAAFLPGSERSRLAVAAVSVGGAAGAIVSLGTPGSFELFANPNQVSSGLGAILLVIFGIIQAVIAVGAYVVGADTLWKPRRGNGPAGPAPVTGRPCRVGSPGSRAWLRSDRSKPGRCVPTRAAPRRRCRLPGTRRDGLVGRPGRCPAGLGQPRGVSRAIRRPCPAMGGRGSQSHGRLPGRRPAGVRAGAGDRSAGGCRPGDRAGRHPEHGR